MADVESLIKTTLGEIERILSTKAVVGEPMTIEGNTIIPLICIGFGFGGGACGAREKAEGAGSGGAGGVRPLGVIVVNKEGVRIEPIRGRGAGFVEAVADGIGKIVDKRREKKEEKKEE